MNSWFRIDNSSFDIDRAVISFAWSWLRKKMIWIEKRFGWKSFRETVECNFQMAFIRIFCKFLFDFFVNNFHVNIILHIQYIHNVCIYLRNVSADDHCYLPNVLILLFMEFIISGNADVTLMVCIDNFCC